MKPTDKEKNKKQSIAMPVARTGDLSPKGNVKTNFYGDIKNLTTNEKKQASKAGGDFVKSRIKADTHLRKEAFNKMKQVKSIINRDVAIKTAKNVVKTGAKLGAKTAMRIGGGIIGGIAADFVLDKGIDAVVDVTTKVKKKAIKGIADLENSFKPRF